MPPKTRSIKKQVRKDESGVTPIGQIDSAVPPEPTERESDTEVIELSPEEDLFITYLFEENMNRTRAYMRVYPKSNRNSASSSASRMLSRDNVKAELTRRMKEEAMSEEEGIMRLTKVSRGTVTPFLKSGPDGFMYFDMSHPDAKENMFLIKEMETKRERRLVGSGEAAEEWEGEWVKVKLHDAYTATVDLLKIYGRFTKKIDIMSDGKPLTAPVDADGFDRSISSLADAVKSLILQSEIPVPPRPTPTPTEPAT